MKVITCFSYKGGAGRTVAASNIAAALASVREGGAVTAALNRRVALLDLDVFSAGTHRTFGISNEELKSNLPVSIQDYLLEEMHPQTFFEKGGVRPDNPLMHSFYRECGGAEGCDPGFTLFPARPDPEGFAVQKLHEHLLLDLVEELEGKQGFDYLIIDGENGIRSMASIALRLADVVLVFFRLTWQHIEGSQATVADWIKNNLATPFYLVPTVVPLVAPDDPIYKPRAPGINVLREQTRLIPEGSGLNEQCAAHREPCGYGSFWCRPDDKDGPLCVHESLVLKGGERVVVFDPDPEIRRDRVASDYYRIAAELNRVHPPR